MKKLIMPLLFCSAVVLAQQTVTTLSIKLSYDQSQGLLWATDRYNHTSGKAPLTIEQYAEYVLTNAIQSYKLSQDDQRIEKLREDFKLVNQEMKTQIEETLKAAADAKRKGGVK